VSEVGPDVVAWAEAHGVSFEVEPLVEMVKGRQVQVGFRISLHARLPMEKQPGPERRAAAGEIRERLLEIVRTLAPREGSRARVEIETPRTAVVLEPEGQMEPEVTLDVRVFHGDDYFAEVTLDEEKRLREVAGRLTGMGLKERRRRLP
jgi:hypothetical protein